jgi:sugar lactone lactonase YvrE
VRRHLSEPACDLRAEHAEGPCWDARTGQLLWVDQFGGLVHLADYDHDIGLLRLARTYEVGMPVGAVVPAATGGWMLAGGNGFAHLSVNGQVELLAQPESDPAVPMRMNDGKCDPSGVFWAGSMAWDKTPGAGTLYRLTGRGVERMRTGLTISNGLAWAGTRMYYIDTPTQRIDRFDLTAAGGLGDPQSVVTIDPADGSPDGMCVDEEGCLWVALWNGWAVRRYSPDGDLLAMVAVDAPQVSSCCFGGPDGDTLFITTSQEDMNSGQRARHRRSGLVFRAEVGTRGRPADLFRGPDG